jgi:hypothetical protein
MVVPSMHALVSKSRRELILIAVGSVVVFSISAWIDLFSTTIAWLYRHDTWQLDEMFTVMVFLAIAFAVYSRRRWRELTEEMQEREKAEESNRQLIQRLEKALTEVRTLRGLLPLCAWCKKVRDDTGYWMELESYIQANSDAKVTHGICPDCARKAFARAPALPR